MKPTLTTIKRELMRIRSGTQSRHFNYVIAFSDRTVKVGVTSRPNDRIAELSRIKGAPMLHHAFTAASGKDAAFKIEADFCRLERYRVVDGTREWFSLHPNYSLADGWCMDRQTLGMFWAMANGRRCEYVEVLA